MEMENIPLSLVMKITKSPVGKVTARYWLSMLMGACLVVLKLNYQHVVNPYDSYIAHNKKNKVLEWICHFILDLRPTKRPLTALTENRFGN